VKSLPRAIAVESVETRCSRPLTLRTFGGSLDRRATSGRTRQSSQPRFVVVRMFERSSVVLVGTFHLQKSYGRTRPGRRTRTAGEQRSSRCLRTPMNTCGECPAGQREHSSTRVLARAAHVGLVRWKAPRSRKGRPHWRAPAGTGSRDWEIGRSAFPFRPPREVSEGQLGRATASRQGCGALSTGARAPAWWPNGPKPAPCRQAWRCRRLDDRKVVRRRPGTEVETPRPGTSSKSNAGGFSHGDRRRASGEDAPQTTGARDAKRRL